MKNKFTACLIFFVLFFSMMPTSALYADDEKIDRTPDPYGIEEFNIWQKDLRRFEIISFGALPFVSLLSFWTYDIIRSIKHKGDPAYKPWPLKNPEIAEPLSESEQRNVFFAAVGISIGIALIDFSYRAIKREIDKKKLKKLNINNNEPIQLIPIIDGEKEKYQNTEYGHSASKKEKSEEANDADSR